MSGLVIMLRWCLQCLFKRGARNDHEDAVGHQRGRGLHHQAVGLCNQVPHLRIAPHRLHDAAEGISRFA